jgi:hypothetical protein
MNMDSTVGGSCIMSTTLLLLLLLFVSEFFRHVYYDL